MFRWLVFSQIDFTCTAKWESNVLAEFGSWPVAGILQSLILMDHNQTANKRRRQKKRVKIFLNFTCLHKTQPVQKTAGNFPYFLKKSTRQMFEYPGLDAGLKICHITDSTFPKTQEESNIVISD